MKLANNAGRNVCFKTKVFIINLYIVNVYQGYQCNYCHWQGDKCNVRYIARARLADYSGTIYATMFEPVATNIF